MNQNENQNLEPAQTETTELDSKTKIAGKRRPFFSCIDNLYKFVLGLFISIPAMIFLSILTMLIGTLFLVGALVFLIALVGLFIQGWGSHAKNRSGTGESTDKSYAVPAIIMPVIIGLPVLFFFTFSGFLVSFLYSITTEFRYYPFDTHNIIQYTEQYKADNNGDVPPVETWCDTLAELWNQERDVDISDRSSCRFAMNTEAAKLGKDAPEDMVLFFETKSGWNQSGGIDLAKNSFGRYKVILANLSSREVRKAELPYLRWTADEEITPPERNLAALYSIFWVSIGIVCAGIIFSLREHFVRFSLSISFVGVLSLLVGAGLGAVAEDFYVIEDMQYLGWLFGSIAGALTGICYTLILARYHKRNPQCSTVGFATMTGAFAGILCSTAVHISLKIGYNESWTFLLGIGSIGLVFGIYAGTAVGWICSAFFRPVKPEPIITDPTQPQEIER